MRGLLFVCPRESESQTGVVMTTSQGNQKVSSGDLTWRPELVYQRPENEIREQQFKKNSSKENSILLPL